VDGESQSAFFASVAHKRNPAHRSPLLERAGDPAAPSTMGQVTHMEIHHLATGETLPTNDASGGFCSTLSTSTNRDRNESGEQWIGNKTDRDCVRREGGVDAHNDL